MFKPWDDSLTNARHTTHITRRSLSRRTVGPSLPGPFNTAQPEYFSFLLQNQIDHALLHICLCIHMQCIQLHVCLSMRPMVLSMIMLDLQLRRSYEPLRDLKRQIWCYRTSYWGGHSSWLVMRTHRSYHYFIDIACKIFSFGTSLWNESRRPLVQTVAQRICVWWAQCGINFLLEKNNNLDILLTFNEERQVLAATCHGGYGMYCLFMSAITI